MNKALMISIQPQHAVKILNGKKTLELRTWIPKDYVGWVYVYVTKGKPYLVKFYNDFPVQAISDYTYQELLDDGNVPMNGKVAFRFWFDEFNKYTFDNHGVNMYAHDMDEYDIPYETLEKLCLDNWEVNDYGKGKDLYAWHIKKLEVFDEPKQLSDFYKIDVTKDLPNDYDLKNLFCIKKAPQRSSWVYVKDKE